MNLRFAILTLRLGGLKMKKTTTLKEKIHAQIFDGIIKGKYPQGTILSEKALTEKYKVSRSPVREALVELCNEGVLKSLPRYGYEVVQLTKQDIEDILDFRIILEGGALRESISTIGKEELSSLEEIDKLCISQKARDDFWTHWGHNKEFHLKLMSFYSNEFSYNILKRSMDTLTRAYAQHYWNKWDKISFPRDTKAHIKIISCIKKKDLEGAIHFLKEDIADFGM
jgi:DNA-binding GntR family transcriptional regulator